jgi:hypothetical protein
MAVEYTWEVTGLKVTTLNNTPNVVVQTYWKKTGKDGNYTGVFSGATPFSADSMPAGTTFVPFDQLTEADVLAWIQAVVVGSYEEHVNGKILEQIEKDRNPVEDATLPWATPVETPTP